jgi:SAM-dependent methyltransferase
MTNYISQVAIVPGTKSVLDLCSSWTSHISTPKVPLLRVAGLGMNAKELEANKVLTEWTVQDLNEKQVLPYQDAVFDVILLQLSIDYLTKPLQVCKEIGRVLKPGGKVHFLFSNRLFLSKAVAVWTGADDIDHAFTVGSYLHFCQGGLFQQIEAHDLSVRKGRGKRIVGDPLYVVTAIKG